MLTGNLYVNTAVLNGFRSRPGRYLLCHRVSQEPLDIDSPRDLAAKTAIVFSIAIIMFCGLVTWSDFGEAIAVLYSYNWGIAYIILGRSVFFINVTAFMWRLSLVAKYRPFRTCGNGPAFGEASPARGELPVCSVVVPAYNEGRHVLHTLRSIAESDYPADKLEVIAVDDGSIDDTWVWIQRAAGEFEGRIKTIRLPKNRGKRTALWAGFMCSKGEVLVTIDSDSIVEPQAVRHLVSPFNRDHLIGAVAGCVRVLNRREGVIPRMLGVSFAYSFDFIRASQSVVNSVLCTPGALSAYRRQALMKVLDVWMNQKFFGQPCTIGEDRAMTNLILREGYHVTFQSDAIVYTNVPTQYKGLCKMFLRWARSNVRETVLMAKFIFRRFRQTPAGGARINFALSVANLLLPQLLLVGLLYCVFWQPVLFLTQTLMTSALVAAVPAIFYAWRRRSSSAVWAFLYSMFWFFGLAWITPWSILTVCNGRWLTRDIPETVRPNTPVRVVHRPAA